LEYACKYAFKHAAEAERHGVSQLHGVAKFHDQPGLTSSDRLPRSYGPVRFRTHYLLDVFNTDRDLLHLASQHNLTSVVAHLQARSDGLAVKTVKSVLLAAIAAGNKAMVVSLVAKGVNAKIRDAFDTVMVLVLRKDFYDIVEKSKEDYMWRPAQVTIISTDELSHEIEPFVTGLLGDSPHSGKSTQRLNLALLAASSEGNTAFANALLRRGADLCANGCYEYGRYAHKETHPLEEAASWGHDETLKTLLQKANVIRLDYRYYQEALDTASSMRLISTTAILEAAMRSRVPSLEPSGKLRCSGDNFCFRSEHLRICRGYVLQPTTRGKALVHVGTLFGKILDIYIRPNLKCLDLKEMIQDRAGPPPDQQYLVHRGCLIREDEYLCDRLFDSRDAFWGNRIELILPIWGSKRPH
jgi:hypothetical protein